MKEYKAVFFDLDHTLWDFEMNSLEAINELFDIHQLAAKGVPAKKDFIETYRLINDELWELYHMNKITKEMLRNGRFQKVLLAFNIDDALLSKKLADDYLSISPKKKNLFPGTIPLLEYLSQKYSIHIITNGFKEVQYTKIKNSGLEKYFEHIHISEEIGFKKPQAEIFHYAVSKSGTVHESCIMIGDNVETDITGALNAGIDHILFNPLQIKVPSIVKKSISRLNELHSIL